MAWVSVTPEVGKTYIVRDSRKGTFTMRVTSVDGEWATGIITKGIARAIMAYNIRYEGDTVTVRDVLCYLTLVEDVATPAAKDTERNG